MLKVSQNVQPVINMLHIIVDFFSKSMCNGEEKLDQSKMSASPVCVAEAEEDKDGEKGG